MTSRAEGRGLEGIQLLAPTPMERARPMTIQELAIA